MWTAQSDRGPFCPLTESLDTIECMNGEHAQDVLNLCIVRMLENTSFRLVPSMNCVPPRFSIVYSENKGNILS